MQPHQYKEQAYSLY